LKTGEPQPRRRWARPNVLQRIDALRRVIKRLSPYLRGRKKDLAFALLATIGFMLLRLLEPWPIKIVLDNVLLGKPLPEALSFVGDWTGGRTGLLNLVVVAIVVRSEERRVGEELR